jgi:hypothetical protein
VQTLLAVLAGGPYGPSDGAGSANRSLVMQSCRADGVLLKVGVHLVTLSLSHSLTRSLARSPSHSPALPLSRPLALSLVHTRARPAACGTGRQASHNARPRAA